MHKPFGRRTRSQNSCVCRRVKQDEFIGRKRQEQYRQLQLTGAIQTIISTQSPAQSTRPYAEYGEEYYSQETATSAEQEVRDTLDIQKSIQPAKQIEAKQCEDNNTSTDKDLTSPIDNTQAQVCHQGADKDPKSLQWVDIEGKPIGTPKPRKVVLRPTPKTQVVHYYYPDVPPLNIGRGEQGNLTRWLEDNPRHTEADFYWLRQNQSQIAPYSPPSQSAEYNYLTEDEGQFHDAL